MPVPLMISFLSSLAFPLSPLPLLARSHQHRGSAETLTQNDLTARMLSYLELTTSPTHLLSFLWILSASHYLETWKKTRFKKERDGDLKLLLKKVSSCPALSYSDPVVAQHSCLAPNSAPHLLFTALRRLNEVKMYYIYHLPLIHSNLSLCHSRKLDWSDRICSSSHTHVHYYSVPHALLAVCWLIIWRSGQVSSLESQ